MIPQFRGALNAIQLRTAKEKLIDDLYYAQHYAITNHTTVWFNAPAGALSLITARAASCKISRGFGCVPSPSLALPVGSYGQQANFAKDKDIIDSFLAQELVSQRLAKLGLSRNEIDTRLNKLSDEQIHTLAMRLERIKAGSGGGPSGRVRPGSGRSPLSAGRRHCGTAACPAGRPPPPVRR